MAAKHSALIKFVSPIDDTVWDTDDSQILPGGLEVLRLLKAALSERGVHVDHICQWESYGWSMEARFGGRPVLLIIQGGNKYTLSVDDKRTAWERWRSMTHAVEVNVIASKIAQILDEDALGTSVVITS